MKFRILAAAVLAAMCIAGASAQDRERQRAQGPAEPEIRAVFSPNTDVEQYGRADFRVVLRGNFENPYLQEQASLDLLLTAPSGKQLLLPCYYESGESGSNSQWAARFMPQEAGQYRFRFVYRENGEAKAESAAGSFTSVKSHLTGVLHTDGNWILRYDNGEPFRGVGENICWESRDSDDSKFFKDLHENQDKYNYDYMLPKLAANGGNFTRMWMNNWNFPIDFQNRFNNRRYIATSDYMNQSALIRLDHTVALAESLDIHIMLCMGPGNARTDASFFTDAAAKARYRNRLRYIVARWGYSSAIAMWEFFNEIDNIQFRDADNPIPAADIVAWHTEMAAYLKSIDPFGHIVTTSISHRDLEGLNAVPDIDLNQKHIYRNTRDIPSTILNYSARFGKPYVIGEAGFEWDWNLNFNDFAEDMDRDFRRELWYGVFNPTPVAPLSWWWEFFEDRDMMRYIRPARFVSEMMLAAGKGSFERLEASCSAEAYAVRCGSRAFLYVFNPTEQPVSSVEIAMGGKGTAVVAEYDIENLKTLKRKHRSWKETLRLPVQVGPGGEAVYVMDLK